MIRKSDQKIYDKKPAPFAGEGDILVRNILNSEEEMYLNGRFFGHTTVYPGSAIGYHIHENESETYYILSGRAKFNDNGVIKEVHAGDITFTGTGEGHGIEVIGKEPVEMIALILYDKRDK